MKPERTQARPLSVLFVALALLIVVAGGFSDSKSFDSSEVRFADASSSGLSIVPASCPSNPHGSESCNIPPPAPSGLVASCNGAGTQATLSWNALSTAISYLIRVNDPSNDQGSCWAGWYCANPPDYSVPEWQTNPGGPAATNYTITTIPGRAMTWWVHGVNTAGTGAATSASFTCQPPAAPTVTTNPASNITISSATLNGTANPNGASATGWFRYSSTNPGSCDDSFGTRAPSSGGTSLGSGSSGVAYSQNVSGLLEGATYYYCAIASNSLGTRFGSIVSFATSSSDVCTDIPGTQLTQPGSCTGTPPTCEGPGQDWDGSQCINPPMVSEFEATPDRVRKGDPSILAWTVINPPASCTISSVPSLPGFPASVSTFPSGTLDTGAINQRTVFTMICGTAPSAQAVVTIIPTYIEI